MVTHVGTFILGLGVGAWIMFEFMLRKGKNLIDKYEKKK